MGAPSLAMMREWEGGKEGRREGREPEMVGDKVPCNEVLEFIREEWRVEGE